MSRQFSQAAADAATDKGRAMTKPNAFHALLAAGLLAASSSALPVIASASPYRPFSVAPASAVEQLVHQVGGQSRRITPRYWHRKATACWYPCHWHGPIKHCMAACR